MYMYLPFQLYIVYTITLYVYDYIVMHEHAWLLYLRSDKIKTTHAFPRIFMTREQYTWMTVEESIYVNKYISNTYEDFINVFSYVLALD